jgi:hypothetical protein
MKQWGGRGQPGAALCSRCRRVVTGVELLHHEGVQLSSATGGSIPLHPSCSSVIVCAA